MEVFYKLKQKLPQAQINGVYGEFGSFLIKVNSKIVFSKQQKGRFPNDSDVRK